MTWAAYVPNLGNQNNRMVQTRRTLQEDKGKNLMHGQTDTYTRAQGTCTDLETMKTTKAVNQKTALKNVSHAFVKSALFPAYVPKVTFKIPET